MKMKIKFIEIVLCETTKQSHLTNIKPYSNFSYLHVGKFDKKVHFSARNGPPFVKYILFRYIANNSDIFQIPKLFAVFVVSEGG